MKVLITGASGFLGKNLLVHLREDKDLELITFSHKEGLDNLKSKVAKADFVFHLAGVNRPEKAEDFGVGNSDLTRELCDAVKASGKKTPILYTSSIQVELKNPYGVSKLEAEKYLLELHKHNSSPVHIFRLPNVFGKWCKPNYNSVVATFCHNTINNLPITVNDPSAMLNLVYIDDVVHHFLRVLKGGVVTEITPVYKLTVAELLSQIQSFKKSKESLITERVGDGFVRALYATYISNYTREQLKYKLKKHEDPRGVFVEVLKTKDSGQFSFFTAHKGVTRGGHYHHTKNEKFLVIKGKAKFGFRHIVNNERFEIFTSDTVPEIVETIPGWTHDITNVGEEEMIVMLWSNEIFDIERADTFQNKV